MIDHVIDLSFQVSSYGMTQRSTLNRIVSLSGMTSPCPKPLSPVDKGQTFCVKLNSLLHSILPFLMVSSFKIYFSFALPLTNNSILDHGRDKGHRESSFKGDSFLGKISLNISLFLSLASEEERIPLSQC